MLMALGFGGTILINASWSTWKNKSAGIGVLRAAALASSSASQFLFHSMYSIVNPLK
jgi:hypothetical protein